MKTTKIESGDKSIKLNNDLFYTMEQTSVEVISACNDLLVRSYDDFHVFFNDVHSDMADLNENIDLERDLYFTLNNHDERYRFIPKHWEVLKSGTINLLSFLAKVRVKQIVSYGDAEKSLVFTGYEVDPVWRIDLEDVAAGRFGFHDEVIKMAQTILNTPGMAEAFYNYRDAFMCDNPIQVDLYDCIQDFCGGFDRAEVSIDRMMPEQIFFGGSAEDRIRCCWDYMTNVIPSEECRINATINKRSYSFDGAVFTWYGHYCFAKGRISFDEMMKGLTEKVDVA